jgi:hypothetical protein
MDFIIGIILCIVGLALCAWAFIEKKNISTRNDLIDKENELLSKTNAELLLKQSKMVDEIQALLLNKQNYQNDVNNLISQLDMSSTQYLYYEIDSPCSLHLVLIL